MMMGELRVMIEELIEAHDVMCDLEDYEVFGELDIILCDSEGFESRPFVKPKLVRQLIEFLETKAVDICRGDLYEYYDLPMCKITLGYKSSDI